MGSSYRPHLGATLRLVHAEVAKFVLGKATLRTLRHDHHVYSFDLSIVKSANGIKKHDLGRESLGP